MGAPLPFRSDASGPDAAFRPLCPEAAAEASEPGARPSADDPQAPPGATGSAESEAYERGRADARAELPWQEAEELRAAAAALHAGAARLEQERSEVVTAYRRGAIELGLCIAEHLLGRELADAPAYVGRVVARCAELLEDAGTVSVALHPRDHETLASDPGLLESLAGRAVALRADPTLAAGEVLATAGATQVDARVRSMLEEVRRELLREAGVEAGG